MGFETLVEDGQRGSRRLDAHHKNGKYTVFQ